VTNSTFLWYNYWDLGTLTYSSQHSNFPAANTQRRWASETWRSRYGTNSGWGYFLIESSVNDRIDFEDSGTTTRVASLTPGAYDADTLAAHIETQMEAVTSDLFTVSYSDSTNKFTITNNTGTFELLWNSGSNKSRSAADTLGYDDSADDTGAAGYTADNIRIHSEEWLKNDLGSAQSIQAFLFKKHNLSSTATAKIQGHTSDSWTSPDVDVSLSLTSDITIYYWSSAQNKQWWRYYVNDAENSDGYVEAGRLFLGGYFSPTVNMRKDYGKDYEDPSDLMYSDGGQLSVNRKTKYITMNMVFEYVTAADLATFEAMWDHLGKTREFFFTRDRDLASTTTQYMRIAHKNAQHIAQESFYIISLVLEELR
jgi:hypothetical protein